MLVATPSGDTRLGTTVPVSIGIKEARLIDLQLVATHVLFSSCAGIQLCGLRIAPGEHYSREDDCG